MYFSTRALAALGFLVSVSASFVPLHFFVYGYVCLIVYLSLDLPGAAFALGPLELYLLLANRVK